MDRAARLGAGLPHPCPAPVGADDLLGPLLAARGLTRPIGIPRSFYAMHPGRIASDPARLSYFNDLQENPDLIPCTGGNVAARADLALASSHPLTALVADAAAALDLGLSVGGTFPDATGDTPLLDAIAALNEGAPFDRAALEGAAAAVPLDVQRALATVLHGARAAAALRDEGIAFMAGGTALERAFAEGANARIGALAGSLDPDRPAETGFYLRDAQGAGKLYAGAARLAQAIDESGIRALPARADAVDFFATTPLGAVVVRGGGDDTWDAAVDPRLGGDILLSIDLGGNDVYRVPAGANRSAHNPVAVHVDLGGDDRYGYTEVGSPRDKPGLLPADEGGRYQPGIGSSQGPMSLSNTARQGAGVLGYGFLLDLGVGNDSYRSLRKSQGFGNLGVGILLDAGGDDRYEGENAVQGTGVLGTGLLVDLGGHDSYRAFTSAQGFGWVSSFGMLYDAAGDDRYELVIDQVLLYWSPQLPGTANTSMGQGSASGWRRDDTRTHLGGGLGVLRDRAGDDRYEGATFVQGTGYWMGIGIFADAAGNDRYTGLFYGQGAATHFAIGLFLEGGGDDVYDADRPAVHSSLALGHDYSVAIAIDAAGNDRYVGPDRSLGAGKCHGFGLFVDAAGDDRYESHDRAVGWATDWDWAVGTCGTANDVPTYGFFVDGGGHDTYLKANAAAVGVGDDRTWLTDDPDDPDALELSGGVDGTGSAYLYAYGAAP